MAGALGQLVEAGLDRFAGCIVVEPSVAQACGLSGRIDDPFAEHGKRFGQVALFNPPFDQTELPQELLAIERNVFFSE